MLISRTSFQVPLTGAAKKLVEEIEPAWSSLEPAGIHDALETLSRQFPDQVLKEEASAETAFRVSPHEGPCAHLACPQVTYEVEKTQNGLSVVRTGPLRVIPGSELPIAEKTQYGVNTINTAMVPEIPEGLEYKGVTRGQSVPVLTTSGRHLGTIGTADTYVIPTDRSLGIGEMERVFDGQTAIPRFMVNGNRTIIPIPTAETPYPLLHEVVKNPDQTMGLVQDSARNPFESGYLEYRPN